ncbi:UDP-N-acetylmuramate dehydrogenase [Furfurilactobacillus rossiae]|uniref:UDP-N-acetylenolpyruvoylglucosamine reductase n=1 Tax=Furfurilactobacillus rossiae DSM 15814 TaxID=1114972 RepID=A0A0R1RJW8_9LACO|nr:UDP-N-acetylmuramate dehydrogenase [Furfurilactobacillus rossiae]KRL56601.1 UDP-N-acetylenolpyruvoylglucosamine reductase [Furfurilactobacillus rossiae DSM 15814]MCF6166461.1 UDP-N-acetylmuramate dehydrogenase [Furfurilactobacillus rossiae]QLE61960.1 UDP-N-acetylenolpyruvoylglucosamine reductase [Furfurilactobacillus rossiae]QLE64685.1 UDP-N-acetylenolpyruvoylglucosamine reductase [Furfurilactobacillus rossiae]
MGDIMQQVDLKTVFASSKVMQNEPLGNYTNTKTGGPADWLAFPESRAEVAKFVDFARLHEMPLTVIGNASNLIVRDGGIRGLVLILTQMKTITVTGNTVTADAGAALIDATEVAYRHSLTGFEFAAGIPGSVGGAVFMNAGAYGGEVKDIVSSVDVLTRAGEFVTYPAEEMAFGYRHSLVQTTGDIVVGASFTLVPGEATTIRAKMDDLNARRAAKQPLELPSCGSVFKRPEGYFAGKLITDSELRGYTSGGAQVSTKHAGFIVNVGEATATDYLAVIHHVQETVFAKFGVHLETEVRIIGDN